MPDPIWNLATGNTQFIDNNNSFPDRVIAPYVNWIIRATISLIWFFLYGKYYIIHYRNGDCICLEWKHFRYIVSDICTHDGEWVINGLYITDQNMP